ncbi:hypothetical protein SAMN05192569_100540 [Parageobacillus thermantarcticus]|uniref:Uncharacterized protein n=1 Tax=Parageobacillus thermantarcticus TaxID=186116 RepID=A0A1I0SW15_9BACL|nr:hypothetical protein SAMN05192569_100540 [Parageobacillus thermantarcticus]
MAKHRVMMTKKKENLFLGFNEMAGEYKWNVLKTTVFGLLSVLLPS